jgi:hypothetical protein
MPLPPDGAGRERPAGRHRRRHVADLLAGAAALAALVGQPAAEAACADAASDFDGLEDLHIALAIAATDLDEAIAGHRHPAPLIPGVGPGTRSISPGKYGKSGSASTERKPGNGTSDSADKKRPDKRPGTRQEKVPRKKYLTHSRAAGPAHRRHVAIIAPVVSRNAPNPPGPNRTPTAGPPRSQLWPTSPSCGQLPAVGTPPPCAAGTARQSTMTQKSDDDSSSRRRGG